ncbi:methyltransferase domain-containing protein [Adhaeribacter sp. BT258]|uniref:Methyltransferase domain-containing protein n=1 Tax=Adhaeribacter terrigena TaxID=2793070 RepID=A0ABS1C6B2_9BACT|nr:methyltransferase [Adhaeribacter terrigena]MBK0404766.1 methyltransferase domain-containing protein [Adhaeribacter terrigena]
METKLSSEYWQNRYLNAQTGWDLGAVSPPLKAYASQLSSQKLKILIPGAGNAYEAEYLHQQGFTEVYVADFAEAPLLTLKQRLPDFPAAHLLYQNFFEIQDTFDLILEQTFFCALNPELRPAYAKKCAELLKPGGKLVGLLFDTTFEKPGPPFGGSAAEYRAYFEPYFHFRTFAPAYNSVKPRAGHELFMILERKAI